MKLPLDKLLHIMGGMLVALLGAVLGFPIVGLLLSVFLGAAKEALWDKLQPAKHTVDVWDFIATSAGAIAAYAVTLVPAYL